MADLAETVELVVSELLTNAVQASSEPDGRPRYEWCGAGLPVVHLRLLADRSRLVIEVWDTNPQPPVVKQAGLDKEHGRGLVLVEALCQRWGSEAVPDWGGKVVWAELRAG